MGLLIEGPLHHPLRGVDSQSGKFATQLFNPDKTWAAVLRNALQNFLKYCIEE